MRVAIVGAGAIGGTVGAFLSQAGEDILLVDVVKEHVDAINKKGLSISGIRGDFTARVPAVTPEELRAALGPGGTVKWVFLAVKALHTEAATRQMLPFLDEDSAVVSLQNGLNERRIAALIGAKRTIGAHVNWSADYLAPGQILYGGEGSFYIGELDGTVTERLSWLEKKLSLMAETHITTNIWGYLWSKQCLASLNYATLAVESSKRVGIALLAEAISVAQADGIRLESFDGFRPELMHPRTVEELHRAYAMFDVLVDSLWRQLKRRTGVWRDLAVRKRKTEVEYRVQELLDRGLARGGDLPLNTVLVRMIKEIESGTRAMSWDNLREMADMVEERHILPPADSVA